MDRKLILSVILLLSSFASAQIVQQAIGAGMSASVSAPIALDASCTGNGTANFLQCSSAMTVTAGDTITCKVTGVSGGQNLSGSVVDAVNGWYANVFGIVSPATSLSWETTAVMVNSAGGSITPVLHYTLTPSTRATINCKAWLNVATSKVLDPGAVNQTTSASVINPTSGTAAAPTNNNEVVWAVMSRSNSTAPSSGGTCWLPAGTLTLVGSSSVRQADEYCIQTTATAVNGPFTGNTTAQSTVDSQLALLPLGATGGTTALTGWFLPLGAANSAPTGAVTTTTLGGATSFLSSTQPNVASPFWTRAGATTINYDTGVAPTATGHIMVQGVDHTWGDAGSSIKFDGATAVGNGFSFASKQTDQGQGSWIWHFYKLSSTSLTNNTFCDTVDLKGGVTTSELQIQPKFLTGSGLNLVMEETDASANSIIQSFGSLMDTDLRIGFKIASVNERYHQAILQTKSGSTWSQSGSTMQFDVLCTNGGSGTCANPPAPVASPTGTASSGSTALTVSSGTGIATGQIVTGTGIADPSQAGHPAWTVVEAVSGTSVTLSQNTTAAISGTTVNFNAAMHNLTVATNCTVTAGSTAMSCVAPLVGTIATGQSVGGKGVLAGTVVAAVSGAGPISVTLSIPAQSTQNAGDGTNFWAAASQNHTVAIGKLGSCTIAADQWISGLALDESGTGAINNPN